MKLKSILLGLLGCATLVAGQQSVDIVGGGPAPTSLQITLTPSNILIGDSSTITAALTLADNSTNIDVTVTCQNLGYISATPAVATISTNKALGVTTGTSVISCSLTGDHGSLNGALSGQATLTVSNAPIITGPGEALCSSQPCLFPNGINGTPYPPKTFTQSGGILPVSWTVSAGALPGGLTLNSVTGVLSGTPSANGTFTPTVKVTDTNGLFKTVQISITVAASICTSNVPTTICASTSTALFTGPDYPPTSVYTTGPLCPFVACNLYGAGLFFIDTSIGNNAEPIWRVTDFLTAASGSHTASNATQHVFGCTPTCAGSSNYFFHANTGNGGACGFFKFDGTTITQLATNIQQGASSYLFSCDAMDWSWKNSNILYAFGGANSGTYNPAKLFYFTVPLGTSPWTSVSLVPTDLLDPTGSECNGLGSTQSQVWNKYMWSVGGDLNAAANDDAGAGTGIVGMLYKYQQDNASVYVIRDGTQIPGQRCTWINWRTGQISYRGAAPVATTGFTPLAPPAAPIVTLQTTGGTMDCSGSYQWYFKTTYTIAKSGGETLRSPATLISPSGQGTACSFKITPPSSAVSVGGIGALHPSGFNAYVCRSLFGGNTCTVGDAYFLVANSTNPSGALAQPVIDTNALNTFCTPTGGGQSYTYTVVAINLGGQSVPSAPITLTNCPVKLNGTQKVQIALTAGVTNATSYEVLRDFSSVGLSLAAPAAGQIPVYVDTGLNPVMFVNQTVPIATSPVVGNWVINGTPPPTINTAGITLHGARISRSGAVAEASVAVTLVNNTLVTITTATGAGVSYSMDLSHGADVNPLGSHFTFDNTHIYGPGTLGGGGTLDPARYTLGDNPATVQASLLHLASNPSLSNGSDDTHYGYPSPIDGQLLFMQSYYLGGSYSKPTVPWEHELVLFPSTSTSNPYRACRNFATGANGFDSSPRGNMSQDYKYAIWSDDWGVNITGGSGPLASGAIGFGSKTGKPGCSPGPAGDCRPEVMLCKIQ